MLQITWYHYQSNPIWPDLTKICCFQALHDGLLLYHGGLMVITVSLSTQLYK